MTNKPKGLRQLHYEALERITDTSLIFNPELHKWLTERCRPPGNDPSPNTPNAPEKPPEARGDTFNHQQVLRYQKRKKSQQRGDMDE